MKKYIYVGGGFNPSDLLYILPIIEGYIGKKKIFLLFNKSELQNFRIYLKKSKLKLNNNKILNKTFIKSVKLNFLQKYLWDCYLFLEIIQYLVI